MDCKKILYEVMIETLRPIYERRQTYAADKAQLEAILKDGRERARDTAGETIRMARQAMGMRVQ